MVAVVDAGDDCCERAMNKARLMTDANCFRDIVSARVFRVPFFLSREEERALLSRFSKARFRSEEAIGVRTEENRKKKNIIYKFYIL